MELQPIQSKIYEIRGQRVMLDFDLAELYQVETRTLKQAVRRNIERFEGDPISAWNRSQALRSAVGVTTQRISEIFGCR